MSKATLIARLVLGLIFLVFGLNGFFHFIPMPEMNEQAGKFMNGLGSASYFFPLLKACEVIAGLLLILGAFVPFAIIMLAPIILHIFLFHAFLDPAGLFLPIVLVVLEIYLGFFAKPYSDITKQIFRCPMREAKQTKDQSDE